VTKVRRSLALGVVDGIEARIRQAELKPGERLPTESAIMAQYGVSRTVVREAISHLQAAGLVQTRHGIGTFVLVPPPRANPAVDVLAILELRIGMETEAAWLAASRRTEAQLASLRGALADMRRAQESGQPTVEADVRFHRVLAESSANRYFVEMLGQLGKVLALRERPPGSFEHMHREHEDIVDAIARHDADAARAAMRTHLSNSRERLRGAL
jgi:GntR family transcriptional repressor for pyruvate dehydrogenase complex